MRLHSHLDENNGTERKSGFFWQMKVSIIRILLLSKRKPIGLICELFIPIIFTIGSVVLWALLSNSRIKASDYFSTAGLNASSDLYSSATLGMCYKNEPVGTLQPCKFLELVVNPDDFATSLLCGKPTSGAPEGVCGLGIVGILSRFTWRELVFRNSTYIPTLDEIIPIHWMNKILVENTRYKYIPANSLTSAMYSSGTLFFAPASAETENLVNYLLKKFYFFNHIYAGTFETVAAAVKRTEQRTGTDPPIWGIVVVSSLTTEKFDVTIRLNNTALPLRNVLVVPIYAGGTPSGGPAMYILSGFATLQKTIYEYYMSEIVKADYPQKVVALPAPTVAFEKHMFLSEVTNFGPLIIVFGFLYPVSQMTKRLVTDKELRIRESMLIMGLKQRVMILSWIVVYAAQFLVVCFIITLIMKLTYLPNVNVVILFVCLYLFALTTISLSGLLAAFFSKARVAGIVSPLIYFALAIPIFAMDGSNSTAKGIVTVLSPSALSIGIVLIFSQELVGGFSKADMQLSNPNMVVIFVMLLVDFFLYGLLMIYFDLVLPQDWGTRRHPFFFILDPFKKCCGNRSAKTEVIDGRSPTGVFEDFPDADSRPIQITGLRKEFGSGKNHFVAVNNFYWTIQEGEISVLLGHNGAGKTTLINMMTGMISADAGDCIVYGKSIHSNLSEVRKDIGFCPQHNILWPDLTCREHLWFYGSIKGLHGENLNLRILTVLHHVDLVDKMNVKASQLSGGQKRKLSVAIAFVGGSRFVFLDEPTAGMDVNARRSTWDLLRLLSNTHSILLTTHFMDEADLLGDSVAIMNKGRLQCSGSNFFLKSQLGFGYVLTLSLLLGTETDTVTQLVHSYIPEAICLGNTAGEAMFSVPMAFKTMFPLLLPAIENAVEENAYGITGYSLSATTLEEIFIRIIEENGASEGATHDDSVSRCGVWSTSTLESSSSILWSQFKSQMVKRFWNSMRDRRTQFFQIVCPVVCVLLAMLIMLISFFDNSSLVLSSRAYKKNVGIDVAGCSDKMDLSKPFSSNVRTNLLEAVGSSQELNNYQLSTYNSHPSHLLRYSGLLCDDASLDGASTLIYNASAYHEVGISLFNLYNGYYRKASNNHLETICHCMPPTNSEKRLTNALYAMMICIIIMIPFTFIPSTFVGWIVKEKQCRARHLQSISGLSFYVYWMASLLFDILSYALAALLVVLIFVIFRRSEFVSSENIGATLLVFFLYGVSGVVMAYVLSFFFHDYSTAQNTVLLGNFIAGFLLVLCIAVLTFLEATQNIARVLKWIFRLVPSFCVGEGILNMAQVNLKKSLGAEVSVWDMDAVGWPCVFMAAEFPIFLLVVLFVDHPGRRQRTQRLFHNPDAPPEIVENEDEDVLVERLAVASNQRTEDLVQVHNLRKVYGNGKVAVRNVTFGVQAGEVFGFLGTNGAGKTTTISILCQELYPTSGYVSVCGYDVVQESSKALQCVGYCPQFDATLDLLTVEEHLRLYAGVRGIVYEERDAVVESLLSLCELANYRAVTSQALSGGNRRKLSVAVSLLGGPRVVFLDEPSAGMDPVARRGLWKAIQSVSSHCAIVLTTHHLEEVEALAQRVAIMVDGTLRCIGNKTHLKSKYGSGFEIIVRLESDAEADKEKVMSFFKTYIEDSCFQEFRARRLTYSVPQTVKLSAIFAILEEHFACLPIMDYNVSQTSIEAVFLRISAAEASGNDDSSEPSQCCCCC